MSSDWKKTRNLSQTKLHTLSKVLSKWTLPNLLNLILHCLRHFSIAFKESVNFYCEIMGFSRSLCQAFFTAIIPQEEGIILQQFCMTSLVFNNFQATCRIKVFKVFAFSHIWSGDSTINCIIGKVPCTPGGSRFMWIQTCPFSTYFGFVFWKTLETGTAKKVSGNFCVREDALKGTLAFSIFCL